jgi:glutathione-specific gamma-glutamylcyclotransferase
MRLVGEPYRYEFRRRRSEVDSPAQPPRKSGAQTASSTDAGDAPAGFNLLPLPDGAPLGPRIIVTREGLRDGSLLAAARLMLPPGTTLLSEAAIEADLDARLSKHSAAEDVWLFGYGSLMWNPAIEFAERRPGTVYGWHRRFCLWLHAGRGSPDNPGLMMALEPGGRCAGLLFRIPAAHARAELLLAWRREMFAGGYRSRWVTAMTNAGAVRAVTFVANRAYPRYSGRLDDATVAARLESASGSLGSCAAYLSETIGALQAAGLRDRGLERLRRLIKDAV